MLLVIIYIIKIKNYIVSLIGITFIIIFIVIVFKMDFFNFNRQKIIWVSSVYNYVDFSFNIQNNRLLMTGSTNKFEIKDDKKTFFHKIKLKYPDSIINNNELSIKINNEVYIIKYLLKHNNKYQYILYGDFFIYNFDNDIFHIPFPTNKIVGFDEPCPIIDKTFNINCSFDYLKEYYKDFNNIKIINNNIYYNNLVLKFNNNKIAVKKLQ